MSKWQDSDGLKKLHASILDKGYLDREHILTYLTLFNTSDSNIIVDEMKAWLESLRDDPKYSKINFTDKDVNDILGDLDAYGFVQSDTIMKFKDNSSRNLT